MKLRLQENSVRFRLSQEEADLLASQGTLSGQIRFGGESPPFSYSIEAAGAQMTLSFDGRAMCLRVPAAELAQWAATRMLALETTQGWEGGSLEVVLEKDLERRPQ